jgi:3-oxoacyl-ACP reductase-like protein
MAGKIQLKLKPKAPAAAAAPTAAPAAGAAAAPTFAPAAGKSGGITIELRGTSVHIQQVVVVKR